MGGSISKEVSKEANDRWLADITPVKGEFRAFMIGISAGAFLHEYKFGLRWEREQIMYRLQKIKQPHFAKLMWFLGQFCSADFMVPYFATLYWVLDKFKCIYGIWLIPISEIANGMLKWYFRVPRPGWVDPKIQMKAWSHEYSFPSSHAQMIWALATFFSGTSIGTLRHRLYGNRGRTAIAYWWFLAAPFIFASLVSLSRVYEGVHYPRDIVVGSGVGVGLASIYMRLLPVIRRLYTSASTLQRIAALQLLTLVLGVSVRRAHAASMNADESRLASWIQTAAVGHHSGKDLQPHSIPLSSYFGLVGVLSGLSVCIPLLPPQAMPSGPKGALARMIIGHSSTMGVYFLIRLLEKQAMEEGSAGQRFVRFCRYFSVAPMILVVSPAIFKTLQI